MNRLDELHGLLSENVAKVGDLLKKEDEAEKKKSKAVTAAAIYGLYRFFAPDYLEDFEDDFDDDFDDDFFEDEEEKSEDEAEEADDVDDAEEAKEADTITDDMTEE